LDSEIIPSNIPTKVKQNALSHLHFYMINNVERLHALLGEEKWSEFKTCLKDLGDQPLKSSV
jgi:hypothetical protein